MTHFSLRSKVDTHHAAIRDGLRQLGFDVDDVSRLKGLYDLLVTGYEADAGCVRSVRVEVKSKGKKLTEDEHRYWNRQNYLENLIIAYTLEDVLAWFGRR